MTPFEKQVYAVLSLHWQTITQIRGKLLRQGEMPPSFSFLLTTLQHLEQLGWLESTDSDKRCYRKQARGAIRELVGTLT